MARTSLVLWLDSEDVSGELTDWADTRGAGLVLTAPNSARPVPVARSGGGVSLTSSMLASPPFAKSSNCTLVVACSLSTPAEWGTIFGHFNQGDDGKGGRWHDMDVQLRVNQRRQVSWHTAHDNDLVVLPMAPLAPLAPLDKGIVVYACTMQSTATKSTMRMDANGTVVSAELPRTITEGTAPIVLGSSWFNERSNAVIYELAYFHETLSPSECTSVAAWMRQRWK